MITYRAAFSLFWVVMSIVLAVIGDLEIQAATCLVISQVWAVSIRDAP